MYVQAVKRYEDALKEHRDLFTLGGYAQFLADLGGGGESGSDDDGARRQAFALFEEALSSVANADLIVATEDNFVETQSQCDNFGGSRASQAHLVESFCLFSGAYAGLLETGVNKDFTKAEAVYRRALQLRPEDPLVRGNLAVLLHRHKKDYDGAEACYRRAIEAHPDHACILSKYANFLKHCRGDIDAAEQFYLRAIEVTVTNAFVSDQRPSRYSKHLISLLSTFFSHSHIT
jgi:tetratricopeptide (TPR) repeat protein